MKGPFQRWDEYRYRRRKAKEKYSCKDCGVVLDGNTVQRHHVPMGTEYYCRTCMGLKLRKDEDERVAYTARSEERREREFQENIRRAREAQARDEACKKKQSSQIHMTKMYQFSEREKLDAAKKQRR